MKNKVVKKIIMFILIVSFISINYSYASDLLITGSDNTTIMKGDPTINKMASPIYTIAKYITYAAAMLVVIYKGVQFMNSSAAPEEKVKIKKELIAVVIGALLIFAIGEILTIIADVAWTSVPLKG